MHSTTSPEGQKEVRIIVDKMIAQDIPTWGVSNPEALSTLYHNFFSGNWTWGDIWDWESLDSETRVKSLKWAIFDRHSAV